MARGGRRGGEEYGREGKGGPCWCSEQRQREEGRRQGENEEGCAGDRGDKRRELKVCSALA